MGRDNFPRRAVTGVAAQLANVTHGDILPRDPTTGITNDNIQTLGTADRRWKTLHVDQLAVGNEQVDFSSIPWSRVVAYKNQQVNTRRTGTQSLTPTDPWLKIPDGRMVVFDAKITGAGAPGLYVDEYNTAVFGDLGDGARNALGNRLRAGANTILRLTYRDSSGAETPYDIITAYGGQETYMNWGDWVEKNGDRSFLKFIGQAPRVFANTIFPENNLNIGNFGNQFRLNIFNHEYDQTSIQDDFNIQGIRQGSFDPWINYYGLVFIAGLFGVEFISNARLVPTIGADSTSTGTWHKPYNPAYRRHTSSTIIDPRYNIGLRYYPGQGGYIFYRLDPDRAGTSADDARFDPNLTAGRAGLMIGGKMNDGQRASATFGITNGTGSDQEVKLDIIGISNSSTSLYPVASAFTNAASLEGGGNNFDKYNYNHPDNPSFNVDMLQRIRGVSGDRQFPQLYTGVGGSGIVIARNITLQNDTLDVWP